MLHAECLAASTGEVTNAHCWTWSCQSALCTAHVHVVGLSACRLVLEPAILDRLSAVLEQVEAYATRAVELQQAACKLGKRTSSPASCATACVSRLVTCHRLVTRMFVYRVEQSS